MASVATDLRAGVISDAIEREYRVISPGLRGLPSQPGSEEMLGRDQGTRQLPQSPGGSMPPS